LDRDEPYDQSPQARQPDAAEEPTSQRVVRWKAWPVITVAVLAAVGLLGFGLVYSRPNSSAGPSVSPGALGSDGIPAEIDGQRVYRITDKAEWQNLTGSFLLGAYAVTYTPPCPPRLPTLPPQDAGLVGTCMDPGFAHVGLMSSAGNPYTQPPLVPAPRGATALNGWLDGPAIVIRTHTHDAAAQQCSADARAACEAAVVVEAVVWPVVPSQIAGEHVYRATDQASFASLKGSFLLGGLVTWPDVVPPCPSEAGPPGDGQGLLPYCYWPSIDGLALSPKGSFDEPGNEIVPARVHVNDPLAAECQPAVLADCQAAVVVESVVWTSNPYGTASPTPAVAAPTLSANPVSIPDTGPAPSPITADAAASMAIGQAAGSTIPVTVLSTKLSTYGAEAGGGSMVDADTPVWAVRLSGSFHWPSCGPMTATPHPCPSPATSELILIDARTGAFIEDMMPAPSPS
jgi:hypothetical protein